MKLVSLALAASLATSPALACIPTTITDGLAILVDRAGNFAEFRYADLRNGSEALRAEQLRVALQALMDDRRVREEIEGIDPDRTINPDLPVVYWSDADGVPVRSILDATHVTTRCVLVESVIWDGFDFIVSWRRVQ